MAPRGFEGRRERLAVNAAWLTRLRWVAVLGQLATIAFVAGVLAIPLRLPPLLGIIGFTALSNVGLHVWTRREFSAGGGEANLGREYRWLAFVMSLDLLALTGLLYFAGGPTNPFVIFYFVNLTLSAVLLPSRWCWSLTGMALACLSFLFARYVPIPELFQPGLPWLLGQTLQAQGLFVALAACPLVVIYFILRVTRELQIREGELRVAEQQRARSERLESLGTLAAGAGHELATPLSTIAVVAKELERELDGLPVPPTITQDVALIRDEVELCRQILDRMAVGAGRASGEQMTTIRVAHLLDEVRSGLHEAERLQVRIPEETRELILELPLQTVAQALRGLVQNAFDASPPAAPVTIDVQVETAGLRITVTDAGQGMPPEVLGRAGEPFFTTKEPGKGMGLGLFLARSVLERLGGSLQIQSHVGRGTSARVRLPLVPPKHPASA